MNTNSLTKIIFVIGVLAIGGIGLYALFKKPEELRELPEIQSLPHRECKIIPLTKQHNTPCEDLPYAVPVNEEEYKLQCIPERNRQLTKEEYEYNMEDHRWIRA